MHFFQLSLRFLLFIGLLSCFNYAAFANTLSAGQYHNCAVKTDGTIACWGDTKSNQTNAIMGDFSQVSTPWYHTCGLNNVGKLVCWGDDSQEQITPPLGKNALFTQVSVGMYYTCTIGIFGGVRCWGINDFDQITTPVGSFIQVSAGATHVCGIKSNGGLLCWGNNSEGRTAPPVGTFVQLSTGANHACAVRDNNSIACWGKNDYGQATPPTGAFKQVSAGAFHSCAIKSDDTLICWGRNEFGQAIPPASEVFSQVSVGAFHSCAVKIIDNTISCWGWNNAGQITPPPITVKPATPLRLPLNTEVAAPIPSQAVYRDGEKVQVTLPPLATNRLLQYLAVELPDGTLYVMSNYNNFTLFDGVTLPVWQGENVAIEVPLNANVPAGKYLFYLLRAPVGINPMWDLRQWIWGISTATVVRNQQPAQTSPQPDTNTTTSTVTSTTTNLPVCSTAACHGTSPCITTCVSPNNTATTVTTILTKLAAGCQSKTPIVTFDVVLNVLNGQDIQTASFNKTDVKDYDGTSLWVQLDIIYNKQTQMMDATFSTFLTNSNVVNPSLVRTDVIQVKAGGKGDFFPLTTVNPPYSIQGTCQVVINVS